MWLTFSVVLVENVFGKLTKEGYTVVVDCAVNAIRCNKKARCCWIMVGTHARMHVAFHVGATITVLDEILNQSLWHGNGLGESLFFEIANCIIVGVGNKVFNSGARACLLEQVHEFGAVPLDLVVAVDGAKGNFRKAFLRKGPVANAPNDFFATVAKGARMAKTKRAIWARGILSSCLAKGLFRPIS